MKIPPNYGLKYTQEFADLFFDLAKENQVPLIPFLLEGSAEIPITISPTVSTLTLKGTN